MKPQSSYLDSLAISLAEFNESEHAAAPRAQATLQRARRRLGRGIAFGGQSDALTPAKPVRQAYVHLKLDQLL